MKVFAAFLCLFCACCVCARQFVEGGVVRGYVMDSEGNCLVGARVSEVADSVSAVVSDGDGYFELSVSGDVCELSVDYVGFERLRHVVEDVGEVQVVVLSEAEELREVTVEAGGLGHLKGRLSVLNVEHVTSAALTRAACCNLSESFESNPSVDVSYSDAVTGAKQIQLLGLSGTYVQMLTENFPTLQGAASVYGLDYVPGPWMQSIAVSKGAASVRNGAESMTGQIDVEYKKPKTSDPLLLNLFGSSVGRFEGNAVGAWELNDRLSTALFFNGYGQESSHDGNGDSFLDMPRLRGWSGMNRWHFQTPRFVSQCGVKFVSDRRRSGQDLHSMSMGDGMGGVPYVVRGRTDRVELFAKNGFVLDADRGESVAVIVSGSYHDYRSDYAQRGYNVYQTNIYGSVLYEGVFGGKHKLAAGLNFKLDRYRERGSVVEEYLPWGGDTDERVAGGYVEFTWRPVSVLSVMPGGRVDYSSDYGWYVTPRLHVKYDPFVWLSVRASAGKGWRRPLVLADNGYLLASSRVFYVSDDIVQEESWNYGVSASLSVPLWGESLEIGGEWFYTYFVNQMVVDLNRDVHGVYFYNLDGRSTSSVFQVDVSYPVVRGLTVMAAYRWMDVRCTYSGVRLRKPLTSRYKALFTAGYVSPLKRWQLDVTLQLNGGGRLPSADVENPLWGGSFPWFPNLNAQVTRRFRHFDVYVGGENITGFKQGNPIIGAGDPYGGDFDATLVWGPTMGGRYYVGVRYMIKKF